MTLNQPLRIVLPGGSGQIGRILARYFLAQGHEVTVLARDPASTPWKTVFWDGEHYDIWADELDGADVVINLAGRSVDCRYTPANRLAIMRSRVQTTKLIGEAIARAARPPAVWMNSSTATIYRHSTDTPMGEITGEIGGNEPVIPDTWKFSIDVARAWEQAFFEAPTAGTRKIALRSAMVMSPDRGGVFDTLLRLVRFGLGGKAGSGRQYMSWVHHTDFIAALCFLIEHPEFDGAVNISSPEPLPNDDFMHELRDAWNTPFGFSASRWMVEAGTFLLRTESELILKSRFVVPSRLLNAGFAFTFPDWHYAAEDLVRQWRLPG